jgi:hypothetical protein
MWLVLLVPAVALFAWVFAEAARPRKKRGPPRPERDSMMTEEREAYFDTLRRKRSDEVKAMRRPHDDTRP